MTPPRPGIPMEDAPEAATSAGPRRLWQLRQLGRSFWTLYASSCLVDLGLCLYFFMFSLFLVEHNFSIRNIGFITSALTVGTIAGIAIASVAAKRLGLRTMMLTFIFVAPLCLSLRAFFLQVPAQMGLAVLAGSMMSIWSVCFSPTLAGLTTRENRTFGFSLVVATGIASGALAGMLGGFLPTLIRRHRWAAGPADGIKVVLLLACLIIMLAGFAIFQLRLDGGDMVPGRGRVLSSFLRRLLTVAAIWNFAVSFFVPFANVYLARRLGLSVMRIGEVYTISQLVQVAMVLAAPMVYRAAGLVRGIALTQGGAAVLFLSLARAHRAPAALGIYVFLTGMQWMGGPGLSSLLMNSTPERHRTQASAMHNMVNLAAQAAAAAVAGGLFERYGYSGPLAANACVAALAGILMYLWLGDEEGRLLRRMAGPSDALAP